MLDSNKTWFPTCDRELHTRLVRVTDWSDRHHRLVVLDSPGSLEGRALVVLSGPGGDHYLASVVCQVLSDAAVVPAMLTLQIINTNSSPERDQALQQHSDRERGNSEEKTDIS